jgi:alanyl aminopeptidase
MLGSSITAAAEDVDYRLPSNIAPTAQAIELRLDPSQADYSGTTTIKLTVEQATDKIGIYQLGLDMNSMILSSAGGDRELQAVVGDYDINWLSDGSEIASGDYELTIEFSADFSTDSLGMHRVSFEDNDYVFTQMESMYARRAFPVFDEPSFKIPYQLTITAPADLVVVANEPVERETVEDDWRRVEFMPTPPLPSYLLAFAVGPLDRVEMDGLPVPGYVYTPKGHADEAGFVVREAQNIVAALEEYFGLDYPFRKLDFLAVPEFAFGAMENPGLITYRTDLVLVGDEASGAQAERVLMVIAHEVAHSWYGDLVTMEWWNDLWLNEAFASWMAWSVMESTYPQYDSHLRLAQEGAFPADQRTTAEAIRKPIRKEEDALQGAGLNYTKGHALLRMIERYVGKDVWQQAIRNYIEENAWGNTTESDLWGAVAKESGLDVYAIAGGFLNQPGFAKISIGKDGVVSQERYLTEGREADALEWQIPLNVKYKSNGEIRQTFLLLKEEGGTLDIPNDTDWVFPDAGGNGYYRWKTDLDQFYSLVDDADKLTDREKIALLGNSEALLNAGDISFADYMFVLNNLIRDSHPLVFLPTLEKLLTIGNEFVDDENRESFSRFMDQALAERFQEVGIESLPDDNDAQIQLRPRLVRALGQYGSDEAVREAVVELTSAYFASVDTVDIAMAREAMRVTALNDDGSGYEQYQNAYLNSKSEDQKSNILSAMYFDNPDVVLRNLDFSISADVPAGDATASLGAATYVLGDHTIVFEWLGENLDKFEAKIPGFLHSLMPQVIGSTCSADNLAMLQEFFGARGDKYAASLAKVVETSEACIARIRRDAGDLQQFLKQYDH